MEIKKLIRNGILKLEEHEYAPKGDEIKNKFDLSLNINPLGVSKMVLQKISNIDPKKINHYYPENQELINQISIYTNINKSKIMLGDGCDGCLGLIASTFINKRDKVIIPTPTFHRYEFHTILMEGVPHFIQMKDFTINPSEIINKSGDSKIIFLCNPNNPTGKPIEKEALEEIIKRFNGIVVVDEALADVTKINGFHLLDKYENLIFVRSFSKIFGLASLRIGYIIANENIIIQIKKTSSPFKVNGIAQELAIEALKDKEYIKESEDYLNKNRDYLMNNLKKMGFNCTDSVTTNFLVDVSRIDSDAHKVVNILKEHNILVTDASVFRVPENKYIRVAIATETENKKFIEIMDKIVEGA